MIRVAALYQFARFDDPPAIRAALADRCAAAGVRGTILIAREGINGTIAGAPHAVEDILTHIRTLPGCAALDVKQSTAPTPPFHRMKVRLKREIVTMGAPDLAAAPGTYVTPADWNALIDDPACIVIDTRNAYEVAIGSFPGAIDPGTATFSDFPDWVRAHRDDFAGKTVAMFCTGGIRCEKATAFLKSEGIADVFHLKGGILKYLEDVPAFESRWSGECFVFDERVAVGPGLTPGAHSLCRGCRMPLSAADRASAHYVDGISCPKCHETRDLAQRQGYAERHRQVLLAEARGELHVGQRLPGDAQST